MKIGDCTVLVVKDWDTTSPTTIREMLVHIGFAKTNIYLPDSLDEAKKILTQEKISLILSGIGTHEEIGPELIIWLKDIGIRNELIFVFYSGGGEHYIKQKVSDYGANDYISLPARIGDVAEKIKFLLNN